MLISAESAPFSSILLRVLRRMESKSAFRALKVFPFKDKGIVVMVSFLFSSFFVFSDNNNHSWNFTVELSDHAIHDVCVISVCNPV